MIFICSTLKAPIWFLTISATLFWKNHYCITSTSPPKEFLRGGSQPSPSHNQKQTVKNYTDSEIKSMFKDPVVIHATANHTSTIIFLHGIGQTGSGWAYSVAHIRPSSMKVISPTALELPTITNKTVKMTTSWFNSGAVNATSFDEPEPEDVRISRLYIHSLINDEIKSGIEPGKIIIGGFSQGGAMALRSALTFDKKLGAVVAYCAWLPMINILFRTVHMNNKNIPVLQGHGFNDPVIPYRMAQISADVLRRLTENIDFRTYSGVKHTISDEGMQDIKDFISTIISDNYRKLKFNPELAKRLMEEILKS